MHQFSSGASALHSETIHVRPLTRGSSTKDPVCIFTQHCEVPMCSIYLGRRSLEIGNDAKYEMTCFQLQKQDEHVNYV